MDKSDFFPLCDQTGSFTSLNTELMHQISENSEAISINKLSSILEEHKLFLESGGKGGTWQSLEAGGLTLAVYMGGKALRGKQASFLNRNLSLLELGNSNLECSDFVNVFYMSGNFRDSNLKNCIFIDSVLIGTDFSGADLTGTDFSRALMMNCKFVGANLSACDFENCDLTGSDFTNAVTSGARFPGAKLDSVSY